MNEISKDNEKEAAYLYDLYVVPQWREIFDRMVEQEIKPPNEGRFLDAGCGTGGYAIDLSLLASAKTSVVGIDPSEERLALARGKADVKQAGRVTFQPGSLIALGVGDKEFDLIIGDASLLPVAELDQAFEELARVAKKGAVVVMKLTTRGSFDELFSFYWEALYELGLTEYSPRLESLSTERPTASAAEEMADAAGWREIRSVTDREEFDFTDAETFFASPLINLAFLGDWLAILPDDATRQRVRAQLATIIDRERDGASFYVSIKATLVIGQK